MFYRHANIQRTYEGKFVLNIDFLIALKPDGLCVYETTKQFSFIKNTLKRFAKRLWLNFTLIKLKLILCNTYYYIHDKITAI